MVGFSPLTLISAKELSTTRYPDQKGHVDHLFTNSCGIRLFLEMGEGGSPNAQAYPCSSPSMTHTRR